LTSTPIPSTGGSTTEAVGGWVGDSASRLLAGARVEVLTGPASGRTAITDENGRYDLAGVGNGAELRASKDGYLPQTRQAGQFNGPRIDFHLGSPGGSFDLTGNFQVTFTADTACTALPAAARSRTYRAAGNGFLLTLYGGQFGLGDYKWGVLYAGPFENFVNLNFNDPPVWDFLTPDTYVVFYGGASGIMVRDTGTFPASGEVTYCGDAEPDEYPECHIAVVSCRSSQHRVTLTKGYS